jgi:hypothetical protein
LKNAQHSKVSHKELNKVKQEKESLIVQLTESHALIGSLRSDNTMIFNIIDTLENKLKESEDLLKKFSSDNLKSMLCIHSDISNKPASIVDDMSTSTSHASDSEIDSIDIKPVIVDTTCLENSCLTNHVMPKSKDTGTQAHGKFVPTCHNCGKIGHIRPNCYLLKSHRSWIKQDSMRKEKVKQHSNKRSLPTCHHCGITGHIRLKCPQLQAQKPKKLPTRATSGSTLPPTVLQAPRDQKKFVPANPSGKPKKNKSGHYKRKP